MPTKGKSKGNSGELKIAKFLTELYEAKFMRVPNSGAAIGGANNVRKQSMDATQISYFKSDIIPPSNMRKLVLESKFHRQFPFHKLAVDEPIRQLDAWIQQTLDTVDEGDLWFVIVRINNKGSFALFDATHAPQFEFGNHARYSNYVWVDFESFFTRNKQRIAELCYTT
jgi:hypothetical protein